MARKGFLYYLFSKNKLPLYVDDNGHVQEADANWLKPNGQPAHLQSDPDGWKDTLVKYARNIKYFGLFRDMTVPMKFGKDGAVILKDQMWKFGYEATVYFGMAKLNRILLPYLYESWYLSELNFAKFKQTGYQVAMEALEGGVSKYLKANETTKYTLDIDNDPERIFLNADGVMFDFSRVFAVTPGQDVRGTNIYWMGMIETSREGNVPDVQFQDLPGLTEVTGVYPVDQWQIDTDKGMPVATIKGTIEMHFEKSVAPIIRLEIYDKVTGVQQPQVFLTLGVPIQPAGSNMVLNVDTAFVVPPGHRVNIKAFGGSSSDANVQFRITGGELTINYEYRYAQTFVPGLYPHRVAELLVQKMTDNNFQLKSTLLLNKKDMFITCGDALRGIVGSKIQTTFEDMFYSLFAEESIGIGVEGDYLVIEPLSYFFQNSIIADLGNVDSVEVTVAEDLLGNTLKAGYPKIDYTDTNGKYEFNQGQGWSLPVTKFVKEIDMSSRWRADALGAELLRVNFEQKKTTDSDGDNDTFMFNIETVPHTIHIAILGIDATYYNFNRPAYTSVTGLPHWETYFNLEYSPAKMLRRNGAYLHSLLDLLDIHAIKQQSFDKNVDLATTLGGITVAESQDIPIASLPPKLFKPYYISFKTDVPLNILQLLKTNPYGKIKFTVREKVFYGFLCDGGIRPSDNDRQTWKLLSAPENDLSKLIS
jgi:hypothetical protein